MKSIMKVEIEKDTLQCGEFDNAMRLFQKVNSMRTGKELCAYHTIH